MHHSIVITSLAEFYERRKDIPLPALIRPAFFNGSCITVKHKGEERTARSFHREAQTPKELEKCVDDALLFSPTNEVQISWEIPSATAV